ncbi:hypothetical protein WN66_01691 [Saccharomyces cerevisiae]|nr:hypothetical protein WN66_01691 [Saccharomyces cerevisiae]
MTDCRLAGSPTKRSPSLVKATTDGVVLEPFAFSIILGTLPSIIATAELVVPKSIPITASGILVDWKRVRIRSILCALKAFHDGNMLLEFKFLIMTSEIVTNALR